MNNEKMVENIRSLCREHGISPTILEEKLGFSQGLISRWTKKNPTVDKLIAIADYLNVSLDALVGRDNSLDTYFLDSIVSSTLKGDLIWVQTTPTKLVHFQKDTNDHNLWEEMVYTANFQNSIITISSFYTDSLIVPKKLVLRILPDENSKAEDQPYSTEELKPLLHVVLSSFDEDFKPNEFKVNEVKLNFIEKITIDNKYKKISSLPIENDNRLIVYHELLNYFLSSSKELKEVTDKLGEIVQNLDGKDKNSSKDE